MRFLFRSMVKRNESRFTAWENGFFVLLSNESVFVQYFLRKSVYN